MAYEPELDLMTEGQLVHRDQVHLVDGRKWRLNWRPDNYAKLTRRVEDTTGMVRCCKAATCQVAEVCLFGKPHLPKDRDLNGGASVCYDHRPYEVGGVRVWPEAMEARADEHK